MSEQVIQSLSSSSSIWLVELAGDVFECRRCSLTALDGPASTRLTGAGATVEHLEAHQKHAGTIGHPGASEAIRKLEACGTCGGRSKLVAACAKCEGTGKNEIARKRHG